MAILLWQHRFRACVEAYQKKTFAIDLTTFPLSDKARAAAMEMYSVSDCWDGRKREPRLRKLEALYGFTLAQARDALNRDLEARRILNPPPEGEISEFDLPF